MPACDLVQGKQQLGWAVKTRETVKCKREETPCVLDHGPDLISPTWAAISFFLLIFGLTIQESNKQDVKN